MGCRTPRPTTALCRWVSSRHGLQRVPAARGSGVPPYLLLWRIRALRQHCRSATSTQRTSVTGRSSPQNGQPVTSMKAPDHAPKCIVREHTSNTRSGCFLSFPICPARDAYALKPGFLGLREPRHPKLRLRRTAVVATRPPTRRRIAARARVAIRRRAHGLLRNHRRRGLGSSFLRHATCGISSDAISSCVSMSFR
jgi:hypothetical protein